MENENFGAKTSALIHNLVDIFSKRNESMNSDSEDAVSVMILSMVDKDTTLVATSMSIESFEIMLSTFLAKHPAYITAAHDATEYGSKLAVMSLLKELAVDIDDSEKEKEDAE